MLTSVTNKYQIILASNSPRRKELLAEIIPDFKIEIKDVEEIYPNHLKNEEVAIYLSELKSKPFTDTIKPNQLIITSDTIVVSGDSVLGKSKTKENAFEMLKQLSGKVHEVITGVTLRTKNKTVSFYDTTKVEFYDLTNEEINYYINKCKPFDKAGSYGIQEWIGYIGIKKMDGDFYNVMGLPLHKLYRELQKLD